MNMPDNNIPLKKRAAKGAGFLFAKHSLSFLINFIGGIILARYFGPKVMGLYFVSYTVFIISREFIEWGMGIHIISRKDDPEKHDLHVAFTLQQTLALIAFILIIFVAGPLFAITYKTKEIYPLIVSAFVGAYFYSFIKIPLALFERKMDYFRVSVSEVLEIVSFNLVAVSLIVFKKGITALLAGNILRGLGPALFVITAGKFYPGFIPDIKALKKLFLNNAPIVGTNFSVWIVILAPSLLLGTIAGPAALGIAQLGYTFVQQTNVLANIMQRVFLSFLSRVQNDIQLFNNYVNKLLETMSLIYVLMILGTASISSWLAPLIYGKKWAGMEDIIILSSFPVAQTAIFGILVSALYAMGRQKAVFKQSFFLTFLYWAAMSVFVLAGFKQYSMPLAHVISAQSILILGWYYQKNIGKVKLLSAMFNLVFGYAVAVGTWFSLKNGMYLMPVGLWGVYIFVAYFRMKDAKQTFINMKNLMFRAGV